MTETQLFAQWLSGLAAAVRTGSASDLAVLFTEDATWRDFMAFPWDFHHTVGRDETVSRFIELAKLWEASGFTPSSQQPPVATERGINAFFDFTTKNRIDRGYVLLVTGRGPSRGGDPADSGGRPAGLPGTDPAQPQGWQGLRRGAEPHPVAGRASAGGRVRGPRPGGARARGGTQRPGHRGAARRARRADAGHRQGAARRRHLAQAVLVARPAQHRLRRPPPVPVAPADLDGAHAEGQVRGLAGGLRDADGP